MNAVVAENIIKTYGKKKEVTALSDISFNVEKGELFGIIGPDGAGKTSLFRILTTLLLADSGKATVDGFDVVKDYKACLLYTSDAADERSSVDLGGRRIIKKKKQ